MLTFIVISVAFIDISILCYLYNKYNKYNKRNKVYITLEPIHYLHI